MMPAGIGDNGGPPLDDPAPETVDQPACARCQHWTSPSTAAQDAWRAWEMGYGRRVKEPAGTCHQVRHRPGGPLAFAATLAGSMCYNFAPKGPASVPHDRRGFVTISVEGRIVWQGHEGDDPAEFRQGELGL